MKTLHGLTRVLLLIGLLSLLLGSGACAIRSGPIASQVLDAQTGQAIAGAVVLGVWTTKGEGIFGAHAPTKLVGVREAETDREGRFTLERPPGVFGADDESVTVYKFGYVAWSNLFLWPTSKRREDTQVPAQIRLESFPPGGDRRRHIDFIDGATRASLSSRVARPKFDKALESEWRRR
jgi:hypothetical protein